MVRLQFLVVGCGHSAIQVYDTDVMVGIISYATENLELGGNILVWGRVGR